MNRFSKEVVKKATGAKRDSYVDLLYDSIISGTTKYGFVKEAELLAFLSQIGHETSGLQYMEEISSGAEYENRADLGNTNPNDGKIYKGRSPIQITGRSNYRKSGTYLNKLFEQSPTEVSPTNSEHSRGIGSKSKYDNSVEVSVWYWKKGSSWGDLSKYAALMDLEAGIFLGSLDINRVPDKNTVAKNTPFNLRPKRPSNSDIFDSNGYFLVDYLGLDRRGSGKNLYLFELITLGINGGYNGLRDRIIKYEAGRKALLNSDYREPNNINNTNSQIDSNTDNTEDNIDNEEDNNQYNDRPSPTSDIDRITGISTILKPTIKIEPIVFNAPNIDSQTIAEIAQKPFIWLNDIQLDVIIDFKLHTTNMIPTLEVSFADKYQYFDSLRYPNDDIKVKLLMNSNSELLRPIFMEFKLYSFIKVGISTYTFNAIVNVNKLYTKKIEYYGETTSLGALKEFCTLSGLGYKVNLNDTDDTMKYINGGGRGIEFIRNIIKHSYRSDSGFMYAYIDFYYNLILVDIEAQMKQEVLNQQGITTNDLSLIQKELNGIDNNIASLLYLTNDTHASTSPNYFESYTIINNSMKNNLDRGYINRLTYYDINELNKLVFNLDTITTEGLLVLKGSDDKEFLDDNNKLTWGGSYDTDNVHSNYIYAKEQNEQNLSEITKIVIELIIPNPNFNLYKFQKIYILIVNQETIEDRPLFNQKLSGEWLIVDIIYLLKDGTIKQKVVATRRDLGYSQEESNE